MEKGSFIFYKSFYESLKELPDTNKLELYNAICELALNNNEIELTGISKSIFILIKPQILANNIRYENGKKGGRKTKIKPKENQNETKTIPNENVNVNDNVNDNDIKKEIYKERKFKKPTIEEIENYCEERNNGISANNFYDFYESKGWKIGKEPMKDWKACIRTWERKENSKNTIALPDWFNKDIQTKEITESEKEELDDILNNFN